MREIKSRHIKTTVGKLCEATKEDPDDYFEGSNFLHRPSEPEEEIVFLRIDDDEMIRSFLLEEWVDFANKWEPLPATIPLSFFAAPTGG